MTIGKRVDKIVQGTWIPKPDAILLAEEAKKGGFRTATKLASYILEEYCNSKRIQIAEAILANSKKRGRGNGKKNRQAKKEE